MANIIEIIVNLQDNASPQAKSLGNTLSGIGKASTKAGKILTAGLTLPLVGLGVKATLMASDLDESMNKVNVVFGDSADEITDWSSNSATALGQSQQQALEAVGTFGNLFTAMEIGPEVSGEMSTSLVELASDLASFNNIDPTEALDKLRAGLTGETEPLKSLGVNLNQATIAAKAFELGLVDMTEAGMLEATEANFKLQKAQVAYDEALAKHGPLAEETVAAQIDLWKAQENLDEVMAGSAEPLTAAQKAQASYALILEQTTNAQGDFARTSDGLANSTRIMKAQLGDLGAQLGTTFLPIAREIVAKVSEWVSRFQALSPETQKMIVIAGVVAAALGPFLIIVGQIASALSVVIPIISGIVAVLSGPVLLVIGLIIGAVILLYQAWTNNWGGIQEKTRAVADWISAKVQQFLGWIQGLWATHGPAITLIATTAWEAIKALIQKITGIIQTIFSAFRSAFEGDWYSFGVKLREAWDETWELIKAAAEKAWELLKGAIGKLIQNIITKWKTTDWGALGKAIIDGIVNALITGLSRAIDQAKKTAKAIWDAIRGFFKMGSPSKLTFQAGLAITQGISGGLDKGTPQAVLSAERMSRQIYNSSTQSPVYNYSLVINSQRPPDPLQEFILLKAASRSRA